MELSTIDTIIKQLFSTRWSENLRHAPIDEMRKQLHKNLRDQVNGYWSGHTAYSIMVDGGFIVDAKRVRDEESGKCKGKRLTLLGEMFMSSMENPAGT